MKIVSWNANGKFREKYKAILALDADIYVIQECENPASCRVQEYCNFIRNYHWVGGLSYKGLMVFSTRPEITLDRLDWGAEEKRYFIPVRVNGSFNLVAAWACEPYYAELQDWSEEVAGHLDESTIIIGDLNSNVIFDRKYPRRPGRGFGFVIKFLESKGLLPMWHYHHNQEQGKETTPTLFLQRHLDKPFHVDHCFASPDIVKSIKIHTNWQWMSLSDHLPLEIETIKIE